MRKEMNQSKEREAKELKDETKARAQKVWKGKEK